MKIDDNKLGMLEQLTYLDKNVAEAAGLDGFNRINDGHKGLTIKTILECFDEEALRELEQHTGQIDGACMSGSEWAGIIRYLQNSDLSQLTLSDTMINSEGTTLALCFTETNNTKEAIVAFKGTSGGAEWIDNVEGLNVADTQCQKEALDFIENLPYDSITVTGHSKGSNKAMYVAIVSDKVDRCVGYDGQGFSQEFIDKYWAEIEARGQNITNYSLSTDYVHILLFPVPNSNQVYCRGFGVDNVMQHHSPNSLFVTTITGELVLDEKGIPMVVVTSEDASMHMLHEFTTFVLNNANAADKTVVVDYVSILLAEVFGNKNTNTDAIIDTALSDPDALALIIAYLVKYMEVKDLNAEDIDPLLDVLGLNALNELVDIADFNMFGYHVDINLNLVNILNYIKGQLTDGNDDGIIKFALGILSKFLAKDYNIDAAHIWETINSKIASIDASNGCENAVNKSGTTRDFSAKVYNTLIEAITQIEDAGDASVASWGSYSGESWFGALLVSIAAKGINTYFSKLTETNQTCKTRMDRVFDTVGQVDSKAASKINNVNTDLRMMGRQISGVAGGIG